MTTTLANRLGKMANTSTLRLTHYGRRSGYEVEEEAVDLATALRVDS